MTKIVLFSLAIAMDIPLVCRLIGFKPCPHKQAQSVTMSRHFTKKLVCKSAVLVEVEEGDVRRQ